MCEAKLVYRNGGWVWITVAARWRVGPDKKVYNGLED